MSGAQVEHSQHPSLFPSGLLPGKVPNLKEAPGNDVDDDVESFGRPVPRLSELQDACQI